MKTQEMKNYEAIKNVHMTEIIKMRKQNLALDVIIAAEAGVIIVLTTILATMIFN